VGEKAEPSGVFPPNYPHTSTSSFSSHTYFLFSPFALIIIGMTFQAVSYAADFLLHKVEYIHCQPEGKRSTRTNQQSSWHTMLEIHASALTTYDNSGRLSRTRRVTPTPWRLQQITTNKVVPPPSAGGSPVLPCCRFCSASSRTSTPFGESFATELRGKDHLYLRCKMCGTRTVAALNMGSFSFFDRAIYGC
jgi:hypothetical protein